MQLWDINTKKLSQSFKMDDFVCIQHGTRKRPKKVDHDNVTRKSFKSKESQMREAEDITGTLLEHC